MPRVAPYPTLRSAAVALLWCPISLTPAGGASAPSLEDSPALAPHGDRHDALAGVVHLAELVEEPGRGIVRLVPELVAGDHPTGREEAAAVTRSVLPVGPSRSAATCMERGWEVLPPQAGQTLQGRYRICSVLGQGGMGCVYLAQTLALDRFVAIKEMHSTISDPEAWAAAVRQFRSEARILASLEHPGLVGVTDYFEEGNACYLVMSFVDGQNLEQVLLASPHALPVAQVLEWVGQVCDILEYLHERPSPVIVRDLKPSNIMLDRTGKIRLVDFGIARVLVPGEHTSTCIRGAGTPGFSPIEQFGAGTTDARSDLYSLGATLYMLLTRSVPPFSMDRMLGQVTLSPPSVLRPDLPPLLDHLILGMMEVQPHDRPASVREVRGALQALGSPSPRGAATTWSPPPAPGVHLLWRAARRSGQHVPPL